jgi:hypothetical protein
MFDGKNSPISAKAFKKINKIIDATRKGGISENVASVNNFLRTNLKLLEFKSFDLETPDEQVFNLGSGVKKDKAARLNLIGNSINCKPPFTINIDFLDHKKIDSEEVKMRESTCNPFLERGRLNKLRNIAIRNISDDFDGRSNLNMFGIQSVTEKGQKLKFSCRKVASGEPIILKLKVKNILFVSTLLLIDLTFERRKLEVRSSVLSTL